MMTSISAEKANRIAIRPWMIVNTLNKIFIIWLWSKRKVRWRCALELSKSTKCSYWKMQQNAQKCTLNQRRNRLSKQRWLSKLRFDLSTVLARCGERKQTEMQPYARRLKIGGQVVHAGIFVKWQYTVRIFSWLTANVDMFSKPVIEFTKSAKIRWTVLGLPLKNLDAASSKKACANNLSTLHTLYNDLF